MIKECLHCGNDTLKIDEEFCCLGCDAAYKIINKFGFKNYYNLREINPTERKIKPDIVEKIDISEFANKEEDGFYSVSLMLQGLHCAACVWLIESILKKQENVISARINLSKKTLFLKWKKDLDYGNKLVSLIYDIGYKLLPFDEEILRAEEKKYDDTILRALAVAGFGVGNIMLFSFCLWFVDVGQMGVETRNLLHLFSSLIALPVIIFAARPFFSSAFKSIKMGYPNMDLAISIAIFLACIVSILETFRSAEHVYFDSAVMLIFFLLIGRYLDLKARKKAFSIATEFSLLQASFGRVYENAKIKILPSKDLCKDMILLVAPGEKIAADGFVIEGESEIDTALITGESLPKKVTLKSEVFAGMLNLTSALKIKITQSQKNSLLSQIIALSDEVENKKNHYIRIADKLAKYYLPAVHLIAFITFIYWFKTGWEVALMNATAVLIITCPCALALAVPIVQTIAISNFIKKGILIKSGEALEKIPEFDAMVFDKTGSLTIGEVRLSRIIASNENRKDFYLKLAASMAKKSRHPISNAIFNAYEGDLEELEVKECQGMGLESKFENKVVKLGRKDFCGFVNDHLSEFEKWTPSFDGVTNYDADEVINYDTNTVTTSVRQVSPHRMTGSISQGNYLTCFMKFGEEEVIFLFEDEIKSDAKQVIAKLKEMNKAVILLSGDSENIVSDVAKKLAIDQFYFAKTPIEKVQFLEKLKAENKRIVMVGDGLNDAPSLALADVSISFSKASDIAQNIADIIIQGQKLMPIIDLIKLSKKTISLMKQNLLIALIYNLIAVPFAVAGQVVPLIAAIAMSSSSLLVLFNSLRIKDKNLK